MLKVLTLLSVMSVLVGCHRAPEYGSQDGSVFNGQAYAFTEHADGEVGKARPYTVPPGIGHLDNAHDDLANVKTALLKEMDANYKLRESYESEHVARVGAETNLSNEKKLYDGSWLGGKTHALFRKITIAVSILLTVTIVFYVISIVTTGGTAPGIFGIGARILGMGLPIAGNLMHLVAEHIHLSRATTQAATNKPSTQTA